jgi:hypothetical protein
MWRGSGNARASKPVPWDYAYQAAIEKGREQGTCLDMPWADSLIDSATIDLMVTALATDRRIRGGN